MAGENFIIPNSVKFQLTEFLQLAHDETTSDKTKLQKNASTLLESLSKTRQSIVSLAGRTFLDDIIKSITSANATSKWDELPPASSVEIGIKEIQEVAAVMQKILSNCFSDITEIMKELIAINGKQILLKVRESLLHNKNMIDASLRQFKKALESAEEQRNSEKTAAHLQIAGSVVALGISAGGLAASIGMAKYTNKTHAMSKQINNNKDTLNTNQTALVKQNGEIKSHETRIENAKKIEKNTDLEKHKKNDIQKTIEDAEIKLQDAKDIKTSLENNIRKQQITIKDMKGEVSIRNEKFRSYSGIIQSLTGMSGTLQSLISSTGAVSAADLKYKSAELNNESQEEELFRTLSQNYAQDAKETIRQLLEGNQTLIQFLKNFTQAVDSSIQKSIGTV